MKYCAILFLLAFFTTSGLVAQDIDPAEQITKKDVAERLHAVSRIVDNGHPKGAELLRKACNDKDWEVVERAALGLAKHGDDKCLKTLAKLAIDGPLESIRSAAANSLREINHEEAVKIVAGKLKGKSTHRAAEALVLLGYPDGWKKFKKLLKSKEPKERQAAIRGLAATNDPRAVGELAKYLSQDADYTAREAAANGLAHCGTAEALDVLLQRLRKKSVMPIMERRIISAIVLLATNRDEAGKNAVAQSCFATFAKGGDDDAGNAALARLIGRLGQKKDGISTSEECVTILIEKGEGRPQGPIVTCLGSLGGKKAFEHIKSVAETDPDAKTRLLALRAAHATGDAEAPTLIGKLLGADSEVFVREEAAVLCGHYVDKRTSAAAISALSDSSWKVILAASVALGKAQDANAIEPLTGLLKNDSYLIRASAAAGLGRIARKPCVEPLIAVLSDKDSLVRDTALDYLQRMTKQNYSANVKRWTKWWVSDASTFKFEDKVAARKRENEVEDKYDRFGENPYGSFKGIRVIVLGNARDKMEDSLEVLGIKHVMTQTGKVHESGLHPNAVFFANCPGNLTEGDSERLSWFVRSGGYLFATCVAVSNTVMRTFPGLLRQAPGSANPPGGVDSFVVESQSDFLRGVFDRHARPRYQVAGNQLPVPQDQDRVHVLVDSTDACTRWGAGSMAAWFEIGHGIVVDSANHFVLQGFANERLKTADERRSFAIERLGIKIREIRELTAKGVFKSKTKAAKACHDRTMMRLVARFVYDRRRRN